MKAAELQTEYESRPRPYAAIDDLPVLWSRLFRTVAKMNRLADLRAEAAEAIDNTTRYGMDAP